jgi:carbamoyltransferase
VNVLGINAYHGDASACLLVDGHLAAAIEEERLRRVKHWAGFPVLAIRWCLEEAGLRPHEIDHVAVGRDPLASLPGKIAFLARHRPSPALIRDRARNLGRMRGLRSVLCEGLDVDPATFKGKIHHVEHHRAHVASSYYLSPFDRAICVSIDGFGDFASAMWAVGRGPRLRVVQRVLFPHSLGAFYTAGTQYLGFDRFGDEYKVMGLAPYGQPTYADALRRMIRPVGRGRFRLAPPYFRHLDHVVDTRWDGCAPEMAPYFSDEWVRALGPARQPGEPITDRHRDLARSLQHVAEEVYFHVLDHAAGLDGSADLCFAGGSAFNSVVNGKILGRTRFERLFVHPAAGDAGTAVGAAYVVWHERLARSDRHPCDHAFLGPAFGDAAIRAELDRSAVAYEWVEDDERRTAEAVDCLVGGGVVGRFQGRAEWGPRALGNRSVLADPRRAEMKDLLNERVKRREEFRPFAPAVPEERAAEYFEHHHPSPFMNQVYPFRPAQARLLPAVAHVDGSGRLQTVSRSSNPGFHRWLEAFGERTGLPVLLNTSFNENEPIVNTPAEAIACFARTRMDMLVIGRAVVRRPFTGPA